LPTAFEPAIKAVIAYSVSVVDNESTTLSLVITTDSIKRYPTTWSMFTLARKVL